VRPWLYLLAQKAGRLWFCHGHHNRVGAAFIAAGK
jgi:hypothetical protein